MGGMMRPAAFESARPLGHRRHAVDSDRPGRAFRPLRFAADGWPGLNRTPGRRAVRPCFVTPGANSKDEANAKEMTIIHERRKPNRTREDRWNELARELDPAWRR